METFYILFSVMFGVIFGAAISCAIVEIRRDIQNSKPKSDAPYWINALSNNIPLFVEKSLEEHYNLLNYFKLCKNIRKMERIRAICEELPSYLKHYKPSNKENALIQKLMEEWRIEEDMQQKGILPKNAIIGEETTQSIFNHKRNLCDVEKIMEKRKDVCAFNISAPIVFMLKDTIEQKIEKEIKKCGGKKPPKK